jgi:hypothetical protein
MIEVILTLAHMKRSTRDTAHKEIQFGAPIRGDQTGRGVDECNIRVLARERVERNVIVEA